MLIGPSVVVGIIAIELVCRLFLPSWRVSDVNNWQRVVFFDGPGPIFENRGDIFTFVPDGEIRNATVFFFGDGTFKTEYDYRFRTNNLGLVQETSVEANRDSFLVVGDSFTEGQGAAPWFTEVGPEIAKLGYQPVNGGLLGTGFDQWRRLQRYLTASNISIRKTLVVFISDDYHRPVWQPTPATYHCLATPAQCRIEESYFYRLPPAEQMSSWIAAVRAARRPMLKHSWLGTHAAAVMPASYGVYEYLKQQYYLHTSEGAKKTARFAQAAQRSSIAITEMLADQGRDNVAFLHLPQREEIGRSPLPLGLEARRAIAQAGGRLFDGFQLCGLTAGDYYRYDEHPNPTGYKKIAACVKRAIHQI